MKDRIRKIRKDLGMTQEGFANTLSLSRNFVSQLESGTKNPSNRTKNDICRLFSVSEKWLETGKGDMYIMPTKETLIVTELMGSPAYDLVKSILKIYKGLDAKSKKVLDKFFIDLADELSDKFK